MGAVKRTVIEMVVLGVASIAVAATANTVRPKGALSWTKAYFAPRVVPPTGPVEPVTGKVPTPPENGGKAAPSKTEPPSGKKHFEHPYQTASLDLVIDVVNSDGYLDGQFVLVDARAEDVYADGHIEGAIRCFHYELEVCFDRVVEAANGAEKVIVYCNGGNCDDSLFMCQELELKGVATEAIYLFEGGWKEWVAQEMPFVTGSEE